MISLQPPATHPKLSLWLGWLKFLLLLSAGIWLLTRGTEKLGYFWQWYQVPQYLLTWVDGNLRPGLLLTGLAITFKIAGISLGLAFVFGLSTALLRLAPSLVGRAVARLYLETIRNTPLLVQLFLIYFVLSPVLNISAFTSAVLALSLFEGAYASEIFRAGIVSIDRGQWEGAQSIGLSPWQAYRHVILPQAIRRVLPPLTGQAISLIKDSALVSTIAIYDLTMQGQAIVAETFLVFEIWFTVAAIYLLVNAVLSGLVSLMERRLALGTE